MANPRNKVRKDGIAALYDTFHIDGVTISYDQDAVRGSAEVDRAVSFSADDTVALANDGEVVVGKLIEVFADGKATVQIGGWATLAGGTGATLSRGTKIIGDLGTASARGYIQSIPAAPGTYAAASADKIARGRHLIGNVADPTKVWVLLDNTK